MQDANIRQIEHVAVDRDDMALMQAQLLLRETRHRCSNDLQLVVGLLSLHARRAASEEVRTALTDAAARVAVLARARSTTYGGGGQGLRAALREVCEALQSQAEPRSILVMLEASEATAAIDAGCVTILALAVNELATNAIKHAFAEGKPGCVRVAIRQKSGSICVTVDDDGLPFPPPCGRRDGGMGLGLVERLVGSIGATLMPPPAGTKRFEIRTAASR